jgi:hypothetical protein
MYYLPYKTMKLGGPSFDSTPYLPINQHEVLCILFNVCLTEIC